MNLCKIEQMNVLNELLLIGDVLYKCEMMLRDCHHGDPKLTDDKERYLKMAMRLEPNDMKFLFRKKEYKLLAKK